MQDESGLVLLFAKENAEVLQGQERLQRLEWHGSSYSTEPRIRHLSLM